MTRRKILVNARKSITMSGASNTGERTYFSAVQAARHWAMWTDELHWRANGKRDPKRIREKKLYRRALPIFRRFFGEQK